MRSSLPQEMAAFLDAHGPSTVKQIAAGVRSRHVDVARVLLQDGFERAERPEGTDPRSVYYVVSRGVLRTRSSKSRRADLLLELLRDGSPHVRAECRDVAGSYPNNAAAELRSRGHVVRYDRKADSYQLFPSAKPERSSLPGGRPSTDSPVSGFADADSSRSAA